MYNIYYNDYGGENIKKIAIIALLIVGIGLVAGGYAFISNDNGFLIVNNPVLNEIGNSDTNTSSSDDFDAKVVKDIVSNDVFHQSNSAVAFLFSVPASYSIAESSQQTVDSIVYALNVAATSNVDSSSNGQYSIYDPFKDINKDDYVLSPNYDRGIYVKIGEDFTDKYGLCAVDGFIPLGNITKQINTDFICNLECGLDTAYFDLSSPYVYDTWDVIYYISNGEFPDDVQKKQLESELNRLATNYRQVEGQNEVFVNVNGDFTDKYMLCMDCGRYFALGNVTTPLDNIMICDYPNHFGNDVYIDADHPDVLSPEDVYDSWNRDTYLQNLYSNPDYHPIHFDEEGYGEEPQNDLLQQNPLEDVSVDNQDVVSFEN